MATYCTEPANVIRLNKTAQQVPYLALSVFQGNAQESKTREYRNSMGKAAFNALFI